MSHFRRLVFLAVAGAILVPNPPLPAQSRKPSSRAGSTSHGRLQAPLPVPVLFQTSKAFFFADANSTATQRLSLSPTTFTDVDLSPDGQTIACTRNVDNDSGDRLIALVARDGKEKPKDIPQVGKNNYGPSWSPDGTHLIYNHFDPQTSQWKVAVHSLSSQETKVLSGKVEGQEESVYVGWWEPDSQSVWFYDFKFAYRVNLAGEEQERLAVEKLLNPTSVSSGIDFSPSPDGRKILFGGWLEEVKDVKSEEPMVGLVFLHDRPSGKTVRVSPRGLMAGKPQWLPDGEHFLFAGSTGDNKPESLYLMKPGDDKAELLAREGSAPTLGLKP